jgi:foldase protein PrsA
MRLLKNKEKKKMATDMKIFFIICAVIVCILAAAVVYLVIPKDVAVVGDNKVTHHEFKYYFMQNLQSVLAYADPSTDQQQLIDYAKQMALSQAVQVEYMLQEAKKEGFKVDEKELNDSWAEMQKSVNEGAQQCNLSVKDFCEQSFGVNMNQLKSIYADTFRAQKYIDKKIDEMPVDETELLTYYEENKEFFDYCDVRHILIKVEQDAEDAVVQEKNKEAQDILARVNNGEDFAALAEEFSEDTGSKNTGGLYQVTQNTNFAPEFMEWTFSHKPGETGIIQTMHGFHVMKLDNVYDSLESNRDNIISSYKAEKFQSSMNEEMGNSNIKIEVLKGYNEFQF